MVVDLGGIKTGQQMQGTCHARSVGLGVRDSRCEHQGKRCDNWSKSMLQMRCCSEQSGNLIGELLVQVGVLAQRRGLDGRSGHFKPNLANHGVGAIGITLFYRHGPRPSSTWRCGGSTMRNEGLADLLGDALGSRCIEFRIELLGCGGAGVAKDDARGLEAELSADASSRRLA